MTKEISRFCFTGWSFERESSGDWFPSQRVSNGKNFSIPWLFKQKSLILNTLRPRQNGRHFADDTFNCISVNENVRISIKFSLKFVPKGPINNIPALVQIMAWRCPGDKPLSEPMMVSLTMHICVTRPQWVKQLGAFFFKMIFFVILFLITVMFLYATSPI